MEIKRFSFQPIDSSMYVMCNGDSAIIIDPCENTEALQFVRDRGAQKVIILLTHEHYDHISGVNWWKAQIPCEVICSKDCADRITNARMNASAHYDALFLFQSREVQEEAKKLHFQAYTCEATKTFEGCFSLEWGGHHFVINETPGHSPGSCCILMDENICFTGDSLLRGKKTITRLPHGSRQAFKQTVENYLKHLPKHCRIYPGHGEPFDFAEVNFDML